MFAVADGVEAALTFWGMTSEVLPALFRMVAYMDDVAIPIVASAQEVIPKSRRAIEIAASVFQRFHFRLNYKVGKTNLVLRLAGEGSVEIRQQLEEDDFRVKCCCGGNDISVAIVEAYQHLGRLTCADRSLSPDIRMRAAQCDATLRPIAQKTFRAPGIDVADKIAIVRAYLFSILCVVASTWHQMTPQERKLFHTKVMRLWRSFMGHH